MCVCVCVCVWVCVCMFKIIVNTRENFCIHAPGDYFEGGAGH